MLKEDDVEKKKILTEFLKHIGVKECSPKDIMELVIRPFFKDYEFNSEEYENEEKRKVTKKVFERTI